MKSLAALAAALTAGVSLVSPGRGAVYTNTIEFFAFNPPTRTIAAGDTVVWINLDSAGHSVTGELLDESICGTDILSQGGTCMRTFYVPGTYAYHCEPHESMVGTIVVEGATNRPPSVFISSPTNGAAFIGPTNVLIRATATDADGAVLNVTFLVGPTAVGADTVAPFEVIRPLGLGQHVLSAIAFDDGGEQANSPPVSITIRPPLRILRLTLGASLGLTFTPTNYLNVQPQYQTNLVATNWLPLPVWSNRLANDTVEIFCNRPAGKSVFIRLRTP